MIVSNPVYDLLFYINNDFLCHSVGWLIAAVLPINLETESKKDNCNLNTIFRCFLFVSHSRNSLLLSTVFCWTWSLRL